MTSFARTTLLLLFCFVLLPVVFVSQTHDRQVSLMEQVKALTDLEKYEEVIILLQPALEMSRKESDGEAYFDITKAIADARFALSQYDSIRYFLENEITYLSKEGKRERLSKVIYFLNYVASTYANEDLYIAAYDTYQRAITIIEKNGELGKRAAYAYKNIAQIYVRWDNNTLAYQYFDAALKVDTGGTYRAEIHSQIANYYHFLGDEAMVMRHYELGMADPNRNEENSAHLRATGASAFMAVKKYSQASEMLLAAIKYYQTDKATWGDNIITCFCTLADISIRQHKLQESEQYFNRAVAFGKENFAGKSREMAKLYINIGLFYENSNQPDRALTYFQKALVQAFPNFNSLEITDNPDLSEALLESQAMRAAAAKAQLLLKLSNSSKNAAALRLNAARCFNLSFAVAARLRHTYGNDVDKIALSANNRSAYQAAALNLWQRWNDTRETTYLDQLFSLIEQTKAQSLADALQQQKALVLSAIPDSLLQKEAVLRLESAFATNESEKLEAGKDSTEASKKLRAFRQKKAYDDFIDQLGKQYPQFRQYAETDVSVDISAIRSALPDSTVLLSWFDAGDRYLCLRLHGSEIRASEVMRDSVFDRALLDFIALLSDLNRQQASPGGFFQAAHALHQKLFPIDPLAGVKSLLIVPDGLLCYLPFEVLLTAPHDKGGFATAPYMFRQCAVTYSWSAKLLAVSMTPAAQRGFVQFAPFASSARDHLAVLDNSLADVPQTLSSSVLKGTEASTATFRAEAPENNVIHLSTHAQVGKNGVPGIEFFDRTMTIPEIYAQRFQASLVTLSACETGAGKFAGGEGVLSLARAFAYAGAQSMVASLWSVNDRATAALFTAFYQNLQQGNSKSEALRQAKLACLNAEESDARKAPYYWAAFTLNGTDGSVNMSNPWSSLWQWGLAILVLSMAIFWGFRKRRKNERQR